MNFVFSIFKKLIFLILVISDCWKFFVLCREVIFVKKKSEWASEKERQYISGQLFLRISLIKLSKVLGIKCSAIPYPPPPQQVKTEQSNETFDLAFLFLIKIQKIYSTSRQVIPLKML